MATNKSPNHPQEAGPESPKKWSTRSDALKEGGEYPNQNYTRTQSGHLIMFDDTQDREHITFQHRSGARFQMGPTGDIQVIAHNGAYNITFGENRMEVTGTNDVTVKGGGTLKVDGDYDVTVGGNMNMTADNDFNFVGKSFNVLGSGNFDIEAKNMTMKTEGSLTLQAGGSASLIGTTSASVSSQSGSVAIAGATSVGVWAKGAEVAIQSGGDTYVNAGGQFNADATQIWFNSGKSKKATDPNVVPWPKSPPAVAQNRRTPLYPRHG